MTRELRIKLIAILVLAVAAAVVVLPVPNKPRFLSPFRIRPGIDLAGGAELRYRVLFPGGFEGDRAQATRDAADVVRRRVESRLLKEPKITASGDDLILVQLAGIDGDELRDVRRLVRAIGDLEFYAAAPPDVQRLVDAGRGSPAGYKVIGGQAVEERPVVDGKHILRAEPQWTEGGRWVTAFELDALGAKRFDEAAERLYRRSPKGRIVIVLDGEVRSAPVVASPAFHGRSQISAPAR